ncbi:PrsW family glutamic-type intramembrane protease [Leptolyngbya sp. 7M]|uniref:PrsW family glutamic-type intramembrane protease n=1 Tax=Leptolyngbya sp. 7M TaxID=2812896 RepID=UPI001B8CE79D|nr:PrsW family glutamic-type intramembrane protease [Leptolyngbya sp. 7M]QYO66256.1 PrsW family intramembrane metalloprotease [Leptolyngbya sp. 7M]
MKLQLRVESGTLAGQVFDLSSGFMWIGRGENCTVRFDPSGERIASKQHAFIEAKPDGYYITDNNSTNGTLVNGDRITTAKLSNGDSIQFGKNGALARVSIEAAPDDRAVVSAAEFREEQLAGYEQAADSVPTGLQNSISNIGLGHIETSPPPPPAKSIWPTVLVILAFVALIPLALLVFAIIYLSVGPVPAALATAIAFTPALLYSFPLAWLDRFDPEPPWLIGLSFAWGGVVAVFVSIILNTLFGAVVFAGTIAVTGQGIPELADLAGAVISAPVVEEASKGLGLLILLIFFRRYFDDILDGIVFAGLIALGFATVENVLYYGRGISDAIYNYGLTSDAALSFLGLFTLRGILSPWAHVTFTAMIGIGCGISRESHSWAVRIIAPILGYVAAVVLHAIWNGMSILVTIALIALGFAPVCEGLGLGGQYLGLCGFLTLYILFEIPLFLIFLGFAFWVMRRQKRILSDMLAIDIARGLLTHDDLDRAGSFFRSQFWMLGGLFKGKFLARYYYARAVSKLGLSYWHIQRAQKAQGHTASFQQNPLLRDEVLRWKDKI